MALNDEPASQPGGAPVPAPRPGELPDLRRRIWHELREAVQQRDHAWRRPVLATAGLDGTPQARTVVMREVDAGAALLMIATDRRSPKVQELQAEPRAALVFWSPALRWQLRATVTVQVHAHGPLVEAAWTRVRQTTAAGDYLAAQPPGSELDDLPGEPGQVHHLAVLVARVQSLDWLELGAPAHRRARFTAHRAVWLVP